MTHLLITTERTYDGQIAVERQLIGFEDYVRDCPEDVYKEAGGKQTTPGSLCDAISKVDMHNNGQVKVSAMVAGRFSRWVHPKTNQERIYINGTSQLAKVWIEKTEPDPLGQDYVVRTMSRDIHEFNTAHRTIADAKYEVFTDNLGLDPMVKASEVLDLVPNYETILNLAETD